MSVKTFRAAALAVVMAAASAAALASPGPPAQCGAAQLKAFNRFLVCVVTSLIKAQKSAEFDLEAANLKCAAALGESLDKASEKFGSACAIDDQLLLIDIAGYMNEQAAAFVEYFGTGFSSGFPPAMTQRPDMTAPATLTDQQKCGAKKSRTLVKYARCLDKGYTKFFDDKDPAKTLIAKCHEKCAKSIASAEKKGECASDDDANSAICGPDSVMDDEAECRYQALHPVGGCTYPPP